VRTLDSRKPPFARAWAALCARGADEDQAGVAEVAARIVADVRARGDEAQIGRAHV
jgi:hypothetical protein